MTLRRSNCLVSTLPLLAALALAACSNDGSTGDGDGDGTTTGDGDGDGDGNDTSTGDGDGDDTSAGDGDGDDTSTGDGDGDDTSTGDGDGDGGGGGESGDGDGDVTGDGDGDVTGDGDGDVTGDGDGDVTGDGDGDVTGDGDGDVTGDGDGDGDDEPGPIEQIFAGKVLDVDELSGVSISSSGSIYASGSKMVNFGTFEVPASDKHVAVVRFHADGSLDDTFGDAGVVLLNTIAAIDDVQVVDGSRGPGIEGSKSVVALPDGGVMVLIEANDGTGNRGGAVYLARLDEDGELVTSFGTGGFARVSLTDWTASTDGWTGSNPADTAWDIQLDVTDATEKIVLFGSAPAPVASGRFDNDRYVARINVEDGSLDTTFASSGLFSIDFGDLGLSNGARRGVVLPDGGVVSVAYTSIPNLGNHIHVLRLDPTGAVAAGFGFNASEACGTPQTGVICSNPAVATGGFAEAYGVAVQADGRMVTTGYGSLTPSASTPSAPDLVSFRFDATSMDATYSGFGGLFVDSGLEDRGRDVVSIADGRLVHVGKYNAVSAVYVTDKDGVLVPDFGVAGVTSYPDHNGNLYDVDTRGGLIAAVGSTATTPGAYLVVLDVAE